MNGLLKMALQQPPLTGGRALLFGTAALTAPTLMHFVVDGSGRALAFVAYFPSVVLAALVMRSWQAALFAVACACASDWFFLEQTDHLTFSANDVLGIPIFLAASALIIAVVRAMRGFIERIHSPNASPSKLIFSEEKQQAWVHFDNDRPSVRLGPHEEVAEMMEDYIAQVEFGRRLTGKPREP